METTKKNTTNKRIGKLFSRLIRVLLITAFALAVEYILVPTMCFGLGYISGIVIDWLFSTPLNNFYSTIGISGGNITAITFALVGAIVGTINMKFQNSGHTKE